MKDNIFLFVILEIVAIVWYCIGYDKGYTKGQQYERKAMKERLDFLDSLKNND